MPHRDTESKAMKAHRRAEQTHEEAVEAHLRAAEFWDERGDPRRAAAERTKADTEHDGAEVERQRQRSPGE